MADIKNRKYRLISAFIQNMHEMSEEEYNEELAKFPPQDQELIKCTHFVAAGTITVGRFTRDASRFSIEFENKTYYPFCAFVPPDQTGVPEKDRKEAIDYLPSPCYRKLWNPREKRHYLLYK